MAAARPVKDKQKETSERHQAILSELLKDDDNKYCVDCDAKGPRWASWNLGVFLCIRCAGIHRNLGVHISRVKSVNLDSWTSEQISTMEDMGNSKARAVYEANLPDGYKRPQTDSALEQFIRAKYEQKKWIAKEWNPQQKQQQPRQQRSTTAFLIQKGSNFDTEREYRTQLLMRKSRGGDSEVATAESKRREPKSAASSAAPVAATPPAAVGSALKATASSGSLTAAGASPQQVSAPVATAATVTKSGSQGIIGQQPQKAATNVDLLGGIDSSSQRQASSDRSVAASSVDLLADIFGGPVAESETTSGIGSTSGAVAKDDLFLAAEDKSKSQKDSIMALYGAGSTGMGAPSAVYGTGAYSTAMQGLNAGAYGMPGGYAPLPGTVPAGTVVPQPGMPMMVGAQPMASAVIYPGMMVAPIVQQTPVMVNGFAPGYYTQQQHAYLASQQLPQQIATMSLGGQGGYAAQVQPQLPRQAQQVQAANGGIPGWADGGSAATAKTLDFNLWH